MPPGNCSLRTRSARFQVGKYADMVVLSADPGRPPERIADLAVRAFTFLAGRRFIGSITRAARSLDRHMWWPCRCEVRFRSITTREVALIEGPAGWGEFGAFVEYQSRRRARGWRRRSGRRMRRRRCGVAATFD